MTAEIAVLNKHGIALAADSAVTVTSRGPFAQGPKIRVSANKIFTLSKYQPVAVMIYDSAEIMGVPWETVIKGYRAQLKDESFSDLQGYVENFVTYLSESRQLFPEDLQEGSVNTYVNQYFQGHFAEGLKNEVGQHLAGGGSPLTEDHIREMLEDLIRKDHARWKESDRLAGIPSDREEKIQTAYGPIFKKAKSSLLKKLPKLSSEVEAQLEEIPVMIYSRIPPGYFLGQYSGATGVVFAGYGTDDVFPSFTEIVLDEVILNQLMWWSHRHAAISRALPATVCAFAQEDMARTFMEGVDPRYQSFLEMSFGQIMRGYTNEIFSALPKGQPSKRARQHIEDAREKLLESYAAKLNEERHRGFVRTVIDSVQSLPLDDLAEMAESLVNLTSLKRKVSMDQETVSGPIDVAVISAGDGFIWINRKHYFTADRNPQFFANYYRED